MADALALWVYGVTSGDAPVPRCAGVDPRHDAELIRHAGLAAIASEVGLDAFGERALKETLEDLQGLQTLARAHEQVLDCALRLGPVVPFPICTIFARAEHVREMLERERGRFANALPRLAARAEWGVKAYIVARHRAREDARDRPASGAEYFARKRDERDVAEAQWRTAAADVRRIHAALSEHAVGAMLSRPQDRRLSGRSDEMVLNAAYLVPDRDVADFHAQVDDLARRHRGDGLVLELTGPWPAYHFAGSAAPG
jgi:hypothetical protein